MKIVEEALVQKLLGNFPYRFDSKVPVLEDIIDLDKLRKDELHWILVAYEMRTEQENPSRKEETLNSTRKNNALGTNTTIMLWMDQKKRRPNL